MYVRYVRNHFLWSKNFPFGWGITELVRSAEKFYCRLFLGHPVSSFQTSNIRGGGNMGLWASEQSIVGDYMNEVDIP